MTENAHRERSSKYVRSVCERCGHENDKITHPLSWGSINSARLCNDCIFLDPDSAKKVAISFEKRLKDNGHKCCTHGKWKGVWIVKWCKKELTCEDDEDLF